MRRNGRRRIKNEGKKKRRKTRSRRRNSTAALRLDLPPNKVLFCVIWGGGCQKNNPRKCCPENNCLHRLVALLRIDSRDWCSSVFSQFLPFARALYIYIVKPLGFWNWCAMMPCTSPRNPHLRGNPHGMHDQFL